MALPLPVQKQLAFCNGVLCTLHHAKPPDTARAASHKHKANRVPPCQALLVINGGTAQCWITANGLRYTCMTTYAIMYPDKRQQPPTAKTGRKNNGVQTSGQQQSQGVSSVPRCHDVRRSDRPG